MERHAHNLQPADGNTAELDTVVKAWLDTVIVPALVREFLANRKYASPVLSDTSSDEVVYTACDKGMEGTS
jgi:hypothetical protein